MLQQMDMMTEITGGKTEPEQINPQSLKEQKMNDSMNM